MEFSLDYGTLLAKVEALQAALEFEGKQRLEATESTAVDSEALDKLGALCASQASRIAELELGALDEQRAASEARSDTNELQEQLERCRTSLRDSEARVETLLAFVPDRDVAIVFDTDGQVDSGRDAARVARGAISGRHVSKKVVVSRFTSAKRGGLAASSTVLPRWSEMDLRRFRRPSSKEAEEEAAPVEQPRKQNVKVTKVDDTDDVRRRAASSQAELAATRAAAASERAELRRVIDKEREEAAARETQFREQVSVRDAQIRKLTEAVMEARRSAALDRTRLQRGEVELAVAHTRLRSAVAGVRSRYDAEARAARLCLNSEIESSTAKLRAQLLEATRIAEEATQFYDVQAARHATATSKSKAKLASLRKELRQLEKRRNFEVEGLHRDVAELRRVLSRYQPQGDFFKAPSSKSRPLRKKNKNKLSSSTENILEMDR